MPIYAYKCESCGHRQDVLQRVSDAVLTVCPACGAARFAKQVTAAGFQLKGTGWYATDFRDGSKPAEADKTADKVGDKTESKPDGAVAAGSDAAAPGQAAPAAAPATAASAKTGPAAADPA
jgi:putative FmdB family regulatory protein